MAQIATNAFKPGVKVEIDGDPYTIIGVEFVKPGKGQAFTRTKLKHLLSGRVIERTFKSSEKLDLADVEETRMRLLYCDEEEAVFMDDKTYDQIHVSLSILQDQLCYLMDDTVYDLVFYKKSVVSVIPPNFLNMKITETAPGARGDTASGRVMKKAITETGAEIDIPIFIEEGETVKVDTRTGKYDSRV
ncbi:MAG: elongation factor P [Chlamydiota bacterium]